MVGHRKARFFGVFSHSADIGALSSVYYIETTDILAKRCLLFQKDLATLSITFLSTAHARMAQQVVG